MNSYNLQSQGPKNSFAGYFLVNKMFCLVLESEHSE